MSTTTETLDSTTKTGLAESSMSGFEVLAQSVSGIAPSAVMATGPALVALGAGGAIMYSYAASTAILLMVGWCINQFAKREGVGGTLLSYISRAFGPGAGFVGSVGLAFGYLLIAVASLAGVTLYVEPLLTAVGIPGAQSEITTIVLEVVFAGLAALAMVRGVRLSTRVGLVLEALSICAVLGVIAAVLATFGVSAAPLHPAGLGVGGVTGGMVLAILGYVGFESAACMGTEAKLAGRSIPRAVLGSALIATVLYLISSYAQLIGFGSADKITASSAPLNDLAAAAGVHPLGYLVDLGATASFFACVTGSLNAASRLVFAMGRDRTLHRSFGATHRAHFTPHVSILVLSALCLAITVGMSASGVATTEVFAYAGTIGTYGYMVAYILIAVGVPFYLRRAGRPIAASVVLGGLSAIGMIYVLFRNVYPPQPAPYSVMPWIFLALLVIAAAWFAIVRSRIDRSGPAAEALVQPGAA
jgi:amino acid transporter